MKLKGIFWFGIILSIYVFLLTRQSSAANNLNNETINWTENVDPAVLSAIAENGEAEFIVFMAEQADLSEVSTLQTKLDRGIFVFETLNEVAKRTQAPAIEILEAFKVTYRPYWVANMIWVQGDQDILEALANQSDIAQIFSNPSITFNEPLIAEGVDMRQPQSNIEWNIELVNAPSVWSLGYTGQNVVVGGQDTGYSWSHPALKSQYRGWDGTLAIHDYNWHDAIHQGGGVCGSNSIVPCDDHGHGTHTMGTIVGKDGNNNQIGMAPGAEWIGCRNMDRGVGTPASYSECYQWFIAPTDIDNKNPDPSKAPDIVNNSWSCPSEEGCVDSVILLTVVENVRAAGILTVHAAGNNGPACSSIKTPAAIYEASLTVGATNSADMISSFSGRGPVIADGSGRLKPDIVAPGSGVRSSIPGDAYASFSGTSMAAPHVAGLAALMISADLDLKGEVGMLEILMTRSAIPKTTIQTCGSVPGFQIPNNTFGYGRIDALSAIKFDLNPNSYLPIFPMNQPSIFGINSFGIMR